MISFILCIAALLLGAFFYGRFIEKAINVNPHRTMPCNTMRDGIDFVPMSPWKVYLIQFLNIAGTGPIFGAIMGILFGPAAYLWIVLGCVFAGAMHDFFSAMISLRSGGESLPEQITKTLGKKVGMIMRIVTMVLLIMVVAVFVSTPASLLANLTPSWGAFGTVTFWTIIIFAYYLLATLLPIGALIGKIYPVFGAALLIMAVGVGAGIFFQEGINGTTWMPELTEAFQNHHPKGTPIFPMLCITIACGAISGFHATQSPLMIRCTPNEKHVRPVFYGAMITEGVVALIWAAAAIKYTGSYQGLWDEMHDNPSIIVTAICHDWMGQVGAVLAILGVVAAPVTTGDTALRSARLITADFLNYKQDKILNRLIIALPLAAIVIVLMNIDFSILWRYFGWINQTLSVFTLWAITVWMSNRGRNIYISLIPAMFMTFTCTSFILVCPQEQGGFGINEWIGLSIGAIVSLACCLIFFMRREHSPIRKRRKA
ncbi:MAG: carbon starvation protein A [Bacteroidaceae bacterium]|nr:carbon starvation protein A [Bacteroidaceae bacterium]